MLKDLRNTIFSQCRNMEHNITFKNAYAKLSPVAISFDMLCVRSTTVLKRTGEIGGGMYARKSSGAMFKKSEKLKNVPFELSLPLPSVIGDGGGGRAFLCLSEVKECRWWAD